ncbi:Sugar kinase of the NBD/HSP70 family, may contain an N-terminal HTH domain [Paenibacillus uliginis N3/975]|uniref:Sugar kinase of the NBD/HSP70 family, may contain an N-terminal HTH domain n=2 Tax=Paenibacillus TaxID=44249 RepID=A0A1X7GWM4_9BACL|nr:Sugar kinase of the NBD/HSP70 family, may contain an N-terminal HTH domain [Paenibacillus uliginis N3/975]
MKKINRGVSMKKHDQDFMRQQNKITVYELIKNDSPISRASIAKKTGMSPTTVSRIVGELTNQGYVAEFEQISSGLGRKATMLGLKGNSVLSVGVEIDKHRISLGVVDVNGAVMVSKVHHRIPEESVEMTLSTIVRMLQETVESEGLDSSRIAGIGVGLPGIVDNENGQVVFSVQLGWRNVDIAQRLKALTGYEVAVDNELKVKALAEHVRGAAAGSKRTALLGFGTGVGSALIIEGEIYRGESNSAGEIGHTTIDPNGAMCECGKAGCLQTYIITSALLLEANKIRKVDTLEELFEARRSKEMWAVQLIERALTYIAITVNNVLCVYNPDIVILSGELIENFPEIRQEIEDLCFNRFVWEPLRDSFSLQYTALGEDGVMIGSALLAQTRFFSLE